MERDSTTDLWLESISEFAAAPAADASGPLAESIVSRVVDTIGCALGARAADASEVSTAYAARRSTGGQHSVWGTDVLSDLEGAALANGVAARYLDYNDAYYGVEPIHPSDVIPTLFAMALEQGSTDAQFLDAVAVSYEVAMDVADLITPRLSGFDHVNVTMLGAAAGVATLLGLTQEQARHSVSIAVTSHGAFRQARTGQLSMWKAFAAADACRHAAYAALLASLGARGPVAPFTGQNGFFQRALNLSPREFPQLTLPPRESVGRIARSQIKRFPCGSVGQSAGQAATELLEKGVRFDDIDFMEMHLDPKAAGLMVSPEKMEPRTRETADHSIPYVVVSTLKRGTLDVNSFTADAIADEQVHTFLRECMKVEEDSSLGGGHDMGFPIRLRLNMKDGTVVQHEVEHPPGSPNNQMTTEQLRAKFDGSVSRSPLAERADAIWETTWELASGGNRLDEINRLLRL